MSMQYVALDHLLSPRGFSAASLLEHLGRRGARVAAICVDLQPGAHELPATSNVPPYESLTLHHYISRVVTSLILRVAVNRRVWP